MKRLLLIALLFACEGPEGPIGPGGEADTLYVYTSDTTYVIDTVFVLHIDGREIVWLYPDSASAAPGSYPALNPEDSTHPYFDISWADFTARRASQILMRYGESLWTSGEPFWASVTPVTPSDQSSPYYGQMGLDYIDYEWQYAYFYWDTE